LISFNVYIIPKSTGGLPAKGFPAATPFQVKNISTELCNINLIFGISLSIEKDSLADFATPEWSN